ncbi:pilus assembly FimT family protein [Halodesulfovibrio marinisediminis]|uniref:Type II secretion system protein H n=1 Tax=Halodesulfovibrio marinisediminis DSM 17456 TaxID=1121457 RepID=A0A1N6H076_9BACT|nr:prepilin-type N-terminal cleavage/methylation domain-containing protein [Halodesulfovibrio marinisediminis]SIO13159.1 type II secretion system protein H [Halodesulfovibrio marinisediminis DSM 17456]
MTAPTSKVGTLNSNCHRISGFTLFELLIVLVIIGTMTSMLAFNIDFSSSSDMNTAVRRISGAVAEARSRALLKRAQLELRVSRNKMELYQRTKDGRHRLNVTQLPQNVSIEDVEIDGKHGRHLLLFQLKGITQPTIIRLKTKNTQQDILIHPILGIELVNSHS